MSKRLHSEFNNHLNQSLSLSLLAGEIEKGPPRRLRLASLTFLELVSSRIRCWGKLGFGDDWALGIEPSRFTAAAFIPAACCAEVLVPWWKGFGWLICMDDEDREAEEEDVLGVEERTCCNLSAPRGIIKQGVAFGGSYSNRSLCGKHRRTVHRGRGGPAPPPPVFWKLADGPPQFFFEITDW